MMFTENGTVCMCCISTFVFMCEECMYEFVEEENAGPSLDYGGKGIS